jgi:hypothetical protein
MSALASGKDRSTNASVQELRGCCPSCLKQLRFMDSKGRALQAPSLSMEFTAEVGGTLVPFWIE